MVKLLDEPCSRCGWRFATFHICVDLSGPEPAPPPETKRKKKYSEKHHGKGGPEKGSPEWRQSISEGMQEYVRQNREKNKDRDETIIRLYDNGLPFRQIAAQTKVSYSTVNRVLHYAADEGLVDIRPPAHLRHNLDKE